MSKIGTMFGDVLGGLLKKPATELYPFVREDAPEPLRGHLVWDSSSCTGCGLCAKDCPSSAIEMIVLDRKAKRFVMRYHLDQCTFCAQCVESCRKGCISLSHEKWELAALSRANFTSMYGDDNDIQEVMDPDMAGEAAAK